MKEIILKAVLLLLLIAALPATSLLAQDDGGEAGSGICTPDALQESGAIYRICMPPEDRFNGDLIVWAHGYVAFNEPLEIPEDNLCGSLNNAEVCLNELANLLGFGFITTSYATNGLAVVPGVADIVDLVDIFAEAHGQPRKVYLTGASEGGLVTALAVEQFPGVFDGGLAMCGPVGDFLLTTSYFGDFRVLFDYFFPGLMPGSATEIPASLLDDWDHHWETVVRPAMVDRINRRKVRQLLRVADAPHVRWDYETVLRTIHDGLWYSVFATGDAVEKLGGQPYGNIDIEYMGSEDDVDLNLKVQRIASDRTAIETVNSFYQTTGVLSRPLVTVHTDRDQQIPYEHEILYREKTLENGSRSFHRNFKLRRYGHCNFNVVEALLSFAILYLDVNRQPMEGIDEVLQDLKPLGTMEFNPPSPLSTPFISTAPGGRTRGFRR